MAYIYMDESGDLGFNGIGIRNSRYFIITFLIAVDKKDLDLVMKNTYSWMGGKGIRIKETFFHSNKESIPCVMKVLKLCSYRNIKIATLIFDKNKIYNSMRNEPHKLYNFMVGELIKFCENAGLISHRETIFFVASRRETKKELNKQFLDYISTITMDFFDFRVKIGLPRLEKGLEVVDCISFSIFKKYESNDSSLYMIIKDKIFIEKDFY